MGEVTRCRAFVVESVVRDCHTVPRRRVVAGTWLRRRVVAGTMITSSGFRNLVAGSRPGWRRRAAAGIASAELHLGLGLSQRSKIAASWIVVERGCKEVRIAARQELNAMIQHTCGTVNGWIRFERSNTVAIDINARDRALLPS